MTTPVAMMVAGLHVPEEPVTSVVAVLGAILAAVLVLPMVSKRVEENLEPFFLVMGVIGAATLWATGLLTSEGLHHLAVKALTTPLFIHGVPIGIAQVVLAAGYIFYRWHDRISSGILNLMERLGLKAFIFVFVTVLGLTSSIISVIVAAVIFAEVMSALPLSRSKRIEVTVISAFALGLGAALTPVGEPLATIAISKLQEHPLYLAELLGVYIVPGVIAVAAYAATRAEKGSISPREEEKALEELEEYRESLRTVVMRAVRVYIFVAALELLGTSFTPIAEWFITKLPPEIIYWVNTVSAVVDNATLTAAEVVPGIDPVHLKYMLISLLISGGMLIPGNIPNIVAAARLRITSKEWARVGVPLGVALLAIYFIILEFTAHMFLPSP